MIIDLDLSKDQIILGIFQPKEGALFMIIIIIKHYIHTHMVKQGHLSIKQVWEIIQWYRGTEKKMYIAHDKLGFYNQKWKILTHL